MTFSAQGTPVGPHPHRRSQEKGKRKFVIGNRENLVDFTFMEKVVCRHILTVEHLSWDAAESEKDFSHHQCWTRPFLDIPAPQPDRLQLRGAKYHIACCVAYHLALLLSLLVMAISPVIQLQPPCIPMRVALACSVIAVREPKGHGPQATGHHEWCQSKDRAELSPPVGGRVRHPRDWALEMHSLAANSPLWTNRLTSFKWVSSELQSHPAS